MNSGPMTVQDLMNILLRENSSDLVVLASDSEGNSHAPLDFDYFKCKYDDGSVYIRELTDSLRESHFCEDDLGPEAAVDAICFYPGYD